MDSIWQLAKMVFLASIYKGPLQMSGRDIYSQDWQMKMSLVFSNEWKCLRTLSQPITMSNFIFIFDNPSQKLIFC